VSAVPDTPCEARTDTPNLLRSTPDGGETEFRVRTDVHGEPLLDGERVNLRAAIDVLEHALTNLRMRLAEDGEG
jgi:hypothetical protein